MREDSCSPNSDSVESGRRDTEDPWHIFSDFPFLFPVILKILEESQVAWNGGFVVLI